MRKFIITEDANDQFIADVLAESFYPTTDKVLYIKDYLDKNFARQPIDDIDSNGYPTKQATVSMLSSDKQPVKTLDMKTFLRLLDDQFHHMISDDIDRKNFLKQVITDWYYGKITKNGMLTVNSI